MSDQVTITVHRRLPDGTWPPEEKPPEERLIVVRVCKEFGGIPQVLLDAGTIVHGTWYGKAVHNLDKDILAWADVTEVLK